jgi:hypothetical protein
MGPRAARFLSWVVVGASAGGCHLSFGDDDGPDWLDVEPCDRVGHPDCENGGAWTDEGTRICSIERSLYCFQQ